MDVSDVVFPDWLPEAGRPGKEMVEKGVYAEVTVGWQRLTLSHVPMLRELVAAADDSAWASALAYRWAVCFDKFMTGGDVRDSGEGRQLMKELRAMSDSGDDPAKEFNQPDVGLEDRIEDALTGQW